MMPELTFQDLQRQMTALYVDGKYADILDLYERERDNFPDRRADIDYMRSCMAARLGKAEQTIQILEELLADGIWFAETMLRESPSYQPLLGNPLFEDLITRHSEAQKKVPTQSAHYVRPAKAGSLEPFSLLLTLHGNGSSSGVELPSWEGMTAEGWLVAAVESGDRMWAGGAAVWSDHDSAGRQIDAHLAEIHQEHAIDSDRIVYGGFSFGAEVSVAQALKSRAKGFIAVAPGGPLLGSDLKEFEPLIQTAQGSDLRGIILISEGDPAIPHDSIRTLAERLSDAGIPCKLIVYEGQGHVYPADFKEQLPGLIDWLLAE